MRTENDICLICGLNKSNKTNSHFVPVGLLKSNIGKRDYEDVFVIGLDDNNSLTEYQGRSNLKNTNTDIKQNPHSADYIFCDKCESKLAELESKFIPILVSIDNTKFKEPDNNVLELSDINVIDFKVFVYSLIFRLNLQSILTNGISGIDIKVHERLRDSIKNYFGQLDYLIDTSIDFILFTTLNKNYDKTMNYVGINTIFINSLFMVNEFHIIPIYATFPLLNTRYEDKFGHYLDSSAITKDLVKVGLVQLDRWIETAKILSEYEAYMFKLPRIQNLMIKTNQSFDLCENQLITLANEINKQTGKAFGYCFDDAYNKLIIE